jgi:hypothetical protein
MSFRLLSSKVPFILHVGNEGYAIVNEKLLCLKFHLQDTCLLVEKEEFDDNGALVQTVYQNSEVSNTGTCFRVMPGSYTVTGGLSSFDLSQASTLTPGSLSSFEHRGHLRMKLTLPSVRESPEFTLLSSSDDEDDDPISMYTVKQEDVNPSTSRLDKSPVTSPSDSFVVSETPSCTLAGYSILMSKSPSPSFSGLKSTSAAFLGLQSTDGDATQTSSTSIYNIVVAIGGHPTAKSTLRSTDLQSFPHHKIKYLPSQYNGNVIFELPLVIVPKKGAARRQEGMDRKSDGHAWTETQTTNLSDHRGELSFKFVKCLGHLRCLNPNCLHLKRTNDYNDLY